MKLDSAKLAQAYGRGELAGLAGLRTSIGRVSSFEEARCAEWIALACAGTGRVEDAASLFGRLAEAEPDNPTHCANLAVSLLAAGHTLEALNILKIGMLKWPQHPGIRANYGICCFASAQYSRAAAVLKDVVSRDPADDISRLYAIRACQETEQRDSVADLSAGWEPDWHSFPLPELYQYAKLCIVEDRVARAEAVLQFVRDSHPEEPTARLNLAALYERANRIEEATALLQQVPEQTDQRPLYLLLRGKICARAGDYPASVQWFDRAREVAPEELKGLVPDRYFSELEFERGRVLDRLQRYEDAFAAFTRANVLIRDLHRRYHPAAHDERRIQWLTDEPALDDAVRVHQAEGVDAEAPIFIVGFPRSGTTLLDQMLDAHPALQVLEEKPALEAVVKAVAALPGGYPQALATLDAGAVVELRRVYWAEVERHIRRVPGKRLVDKYPFNLVRIHLAMILFPKAKWIFAIRHPCDVVLSCFMQNFSFTDTTHGFWSLEQAAPIYEQIMDLWLKQRARLRPGCLDLRYEDLVADFEPQARRLVAFLGLDWHPAVLAYHEHARTRRIGTPSYHQVIKPIYRSSQNRWLHYRRWFGEAERRLEPFVRIFGYAGSGQ
ncbi:MAG: sulfotransferase [Nevskia sp.]|nr:sulfotransferase [Nevskia sp.]